MSASGTTEPVHPFERRCIRASEQAECTHREAARAAATRSATELLDAFRDLLASLGLAAEAACSAIADGAEYAHADIGVIRLSYLRPERSPNQWRLFVERICPHCGALWARQQVGDPCMTATDALEEIGEWARGWPDALCGLHVTVE
jgi:hypothetical protein